MKDTDEFPINEKPRTAKEELNRDPVAEFYKLANEVTEDLPYVDKTGTDQKLNPMRDVYLEFPYAMQAVAAVTAYGTSKHAPPGVAHVRPRVRPRLPPQQDRVTPSGYGDGRGSE